MAKLGKYTSGLNSEPKRSSYSGDGNGGYDKRSNKMTDLGKHGAMKMTKGGDTATGKPTMLAKKDNKLRK